MDNGGGSNFSDLAEGCVANVLSFTSPRDACRFSVVSALCRSAAESDVVWERFLPADCESIVARSPQSSTLLASASKKKLYVTLCNEPILIDDDRKSFWLDKWSGKKCYMLSARNLTVVWGDTPEYWRWISNSTSRSLFLPCLFWIIYSIFYFSLTEEEVAELIYVCWLEINGKIDTRMLSPSTLYAAYIVFKLTSQAYAFEDLPIEVAVGLVGEESCKRVVYFPPVCGRGSSFAFQFRICESSETKERYARRERGMERGDGWFEVEIGEFFCKEGAVAGELEMSVTEIKNGCWKSGLILGGIEIRPKEGK